MSKIAEFRALVARAHRAGDDAARACKPEPLGHIVVSCGGQSSHFYEPHGACGFAWIEVHPNRGAFAKFLTSHAGFTSHYPKGISLWVGDYGQEYDRKLAYAQAYAAVLREAGYDAYGTGRLD